MSSFRQTLNAKSFGGSSYDVNGRAVEGAETPFTIQASVQPLKGDEMEMLPEARRSSEAYKLYTSTALQTVDDRLADGSKTNPDQVEISGNWYEVIKVDNWQNNVINHYKVIVVKL